MIKIKRNRNCIMVYDESDNRGITFPSNDSIKWFEYHKQVLAYKVQFKNINTIVELSFNPKFSNEYKPLAKYFKGKRNHFTDNDIIKFYEFYFNHAVPRLRPEGGLAYEFIGE